MTQPLSLAVHGTKGLPLCPRCRDVALSTDERIDATLECTIETWSPERAGDASLDVECGSARGCQQRWLIYFGAPRASPSHWVWTNARQHEDEAVISGRPEVITGDLRFDDGARVQGVVPLIELVLDEDSQGHRLTDNLLAPGTTGLVFSSRLLQVLARAGVGNLQYFPLHVVNPATREINADYQLANVLGRVAAVDLERSDVELYRGAPRGIQFINALALDASRVGGLPLFRLEEHAQVLIAQRRVRDACVEAGITGVVFVDPGQFSQ